MDLRGTLGFVERMWERSVMPALIDYVRIPCKSPHFDPDWAKTGHLDAAAEALAAWARGAPVPDLTVEILRLPGRTPLVLLEADGGAGPATLLYGHYDKQPEMSGWRPGLGPWTPVRAGERLYGRGGADDGYAMFACLCALAALAEQGLPYGRCVILIEGCEESGSFDLPHYVAALAERLGEPELVVCLDAGCGDYERLWLTTSLRGLASGLLTVRVLEEGVHSGDAGGVVPSSLRIARRLLARIEDDASGHILLPELEAAIPPARLERARAAAAVLGERTHARFPFAPGTRPVSEDPLELVLNRTWRAALEITGAEGLPALADAGNVLRPYTTLRLSLRLPPAVPAARASAALATALEADPPHGAAVRFTPEWQADGWDAPAFAPWLSETLAAASRACFGNDAQYMGEGGTIPFMAMLAERFPAAQFLVTGVLGPHANAHGPNEFLHLPTAVRLSACVAAVLAAQAARGG